MSILSCPDCNGKVSDSAKACPHCGKPVKGAAPMPAAPLAAPSGGSAFLDPKANAKAIKGILLTVFVLVGVLAIVWFTFARAADVKGSPISNALMGKPKPLILDEVITIKADYMHTYTVNICNAPGMLVGSFQVQGASIKLKGAMDDTLGEFHILGPNNEKMDRLESPTGGNFSIRVSAPGVYKLCFSNAGFLRSSERRVTLTGKYQAD